MPRFVVAELERRTDLHDRLVVRLLIHDYAGHPGPIELSRVLAARGHEVVHAFFAADSGPKGRTTRTTKDPTTLDFTPVDIPLQYSKTNFVKRRIGDIKYGEALARLVDEVEPDVVLSGNTPTEAQESIVRAAKVCRAAFIYWCQDYYSLAVTRLLSARLPGVGHVIGAYYRHLEKAQMRSSDHIIHITTSFLAQTERWGIPEARVTVIPNWGALDELPQLDPVNRWSLEKGFAAEPNLLYTGTLALKHNPALLAALAREVRRTESGRVVVVAAGVGFNALGAQKSADPMLEDLQMLPLQPFDRFAEVLSCASVLLAVIERDAGEFSVPSKVLNYLCAGKPIVLAAPSDNLATRIVVDSGAGIAVEPDDEHGFVAAVQYFLSHPSASTAAGAAGRRYAEENFQLDMVADRFDRVFEKAVARASR